MFEEGALRLGCRVVPAGVGNFDLAVRAARDLGATAYIGLPSYLKALLEKADASAMVTADNMNTVRRPILSPSHPQKNAPGTAPRPEASRIPRPSNRSATIAWSAPQ